MTTLRLPAPYRLARGRRNPIAEWLDGLGLFGLRSHEKFIPQRVFGLPKEQITLFLRHLWATDGSVTCQQVGSGRTGLLLARPAGDCSRTSPGCCCGSASRARLRACPVADHRPQYTLDISGRDDQLRFLREIGVHGARGGCMCGAAHVVWKRS